MYTVSRGERMARMEDIPIGLILDDEETAERETEMETLLGAITKPPTDERRGNPGGCLATVREC